MLIILRIQDFLLNKIAQESIKLLKKIKRQLVKKHDISAFVHKSKWWRHLEALNKALCRN